jgi:hypothetical protein
MKKILFLSFIIVFAFASSCKVTDKKSLSQTPRRFFSDDSFWNQPIPDNAETDPRSEKWISLLKTEPTKENFGISYSKWTIPVYEVDSTTPVYEMKNYYLSEEEKLHWHIDKNSFGHGPGFKYVPIPNGATPDSMTDAHYVAVDWDRMLAWDMWGMKKNSDGTYTSNTGMFYRLDGTGVFDYRELGVKNGESIHFWTRPCCGRSCNGWPYYV